MPNFISAWPPIDLEYSGSHAMCNYTAVTHGVIEAFRSAYAAELDLSEVVPGLDATAGAIIVAESMEADALLHAPADVLFSTPFDHFSDWALAVLAQALFDIVRQTSSKKRPLVGHLQKMQIRAWAALEQALDSPTASPLLWYEELYFDVAQEYRLDGDSYAVTLMMRGLAHSLRFNEGNNAESFLRDLAETYLWVDRLNDALALYTALIQNEPGNIWHYNNIALSYCQAGLPRLGIQATRRGLDLIDATGDSEGLAEQLRGALSEFEDCKESDRESELALAVIADFDAALSLRFDDGRNIPYQELARELLPELDTVPVKRAAEAPILPKPDLSAANARSSVQRHLSTSEMAGPDQSLGRNDPCWCGSGKKYKHCHLREDKQKKR